MIGLIKREFLRNKISFIVYVSIGVLSAWMYIALFPSIQKQSEQLDEIMKTFPPALMEAFGVDKTGFNTIEKFLSTELMSFIWPILVILFSLSRAGASIAGSIENRTLGLEISMPISRMKLFISKLLGEFLAMLIFCSISILSIILLCELHGIEVNVGRILNLALLCFIFGITLVSASFAVSASVSEKGVVYFSLGGALFVSYISNIVANISSNMSWAKYFSVFHYFSTYEVLSGDPIRLTSILFFSALTLISIVLGIFSFRSRDIPV